MLVLRVQKEAGGGRGLSRGDRCVTSWRRFASAGPVRPRWGGGDEALLQQSAAHLLIGAEEDEAAGTDEGHPGYTACKQTEGEEEEVLIFTTTSYLQKQNGKYYYYFLLKS